MKVITLHPLQFESRCRELQQVVARQFSPHIVVGIASGGTFVAENMFAGLPHIIASCRRPSTAAKERHSSLFALVKRMPEWMRNILRKAESLMLEAKPKKKALDADIESATELDGKRILVVDDAVDSGLTLKAVLEKLRFLAPKAEIRAAVITVTTKNPAVRPEYTLYNNRTLIRFPWSKDYRPEK